MHIYKKIQILVILSFLIFLAGCIKKLDGDGLTFKIDESELNKSSKEFPIKKDFIFANVELGKPNIFIKKGTNRLNATIDMNLSAIFIPQANSSIAVSGIPFFNKTNSSIYLKDIQIEKFDLSNLDINREFTNLIITNMKPVIDNIFTNIPIYEIDKSSFKGSFVKDIKIEDSELLVTFGL